jgi:23S rRNA (guanine745-N1)-methyltransferase
MPAWSVPDTLGAVAARLRCPHCGAPLAVSDRTLTCARGHAFDVARQGIVALLPPRGTVARGDSAAMVAARAAFLDAGHYAPITRALVAAAGGGGPAPGAVAALAVPPNAAGGRLVVDLGAGTGHHLAAVLDDLEGSHGVALDASRHALRRAVRAHPRIAAVVGDVWREIPVQDGAADLVLDVFAPRHGAEIARVLAPGGAFVVLSPTPSHLRALVDALGMVRVDADKEERVRATLTPHLTATASESIEFAMRLPHADARALVAMGPTAHHVDADELDRRLAALPEPVDVTASVRVDIFRPGQGITAAR